MEPSKLLSPSTGLVVWTIFTVVSFIAIVFIIALLIWKNRKHKVQSHS